MFHVFLFLFVCLVEIWAFAKTATSPSLYRLFLYRQSPPSVNPARDSLNVSNLFWGCVFSRFMHVVCQWGRSAFFFFFFFFFPPGICYPFFLWCLASVLYILWYFSNLPTPPLSSLPSPQPTQSSKVYRILSSALNNVTATSS